MLDSHVLLLFQHIAALLSTGNRMHSISWKNNVSQEQCKSAECPKTAFLRYNCLNQKSNKGVPTRSCEAFWTLLAKHKHRCFTYARLSRLYILMMCIQILHFVFQHFVKKRVFALFADMLLVVGSHVLLHLVIWIITLIPALRFVCVRNRSALLR